MDREGLEGASPAGTVCLAVWQAEDGRCERCGRPMDRQVAAVIPRRSPPATLEDWVLVCPFCREDLQAPFLDLKIDKTVAAQLSAGLHLPKPQAAEWLRHALDQHAVILQCQRKALLVWLPGVGRGWVGHRMEAPPILRHWYRPRDGGWTVTIQSQARTRGLPVPEGPERGVWSGFRPFPRLANLEKPKGVTRMQPAKVKSIKVAVTLPLDQWPTDLEQVTTPQMALTFRTPQGVTLTALVKTKSARKAAKTMDEIRDRGQVPVIVVQGQLMPEGRLDAAGFQVQGRSADR